jgi:hypothetical protein
MKKTITLYTLAWDGYWDKHGKKWSYYINNLNTSPDEIIIVSDLPIETSFINHPNVKNIIKATDTYQDIIALYRNIAIENSSCDWIVASDIDDMPLPNYLDGLDIDADICGFSFMEQATSAVYKPDSWSLEKRFLEIFDNTLIPGTSAIKRSVFDKLRYERGALEDLVLWCMSFKSNLSFANSNPDQVRFIYAGYHMRPSRDEIRRVSDIYKKVLRNDRSVYCFWFSETMSENRQKSIDMMKNSCNVNLVLINNETFYQYENKEIPIHPGFKYLSDVDKSNYARAYMMYFYGEGYSDIKANSFDWNPYFDQLFTSNKDAAGVETRDFENVGNFWQDNMHHRNDVLNNYQKFIGMGHFIFKPKTELARIWLTLIHKTIDEKYDQLIANPSKHPYSVNGGIHASYEGYVDPSMINPEYPFGWAEIGGIALHKAQHSQGIKDQILTMPWFNMSNYR